MCFFTKFRPVCEASQPEDTCASAASPCDALECEKSYCSTSDETQQSEAPPSPADSANASMPSSPCPSPCETPDSALSRSMSLDSPRRKSVVWSDDAGLPLVAEQTFMKTDETWRCSPSARAGRAPRLGIFAPIPRAACKGATAAPAAVFMSTVPGSFEEIVRELGSHGVQLTSAFIHGPKVFVTACVLNIAYDKDVLVRVTRDSWTSYTDIKLEHVPGSSDGRTDHYQGCLDITDSMDMALCYRAGGREFWDNNHGGNYVIRKPENPIKAA